MFKGEKKVKLDEGSLGWIAFTAWVGALVYFVQQSDGFWQFILAILKSIVWPAFLVFWGLESLNR
jgi:hypothetical protein